MGNAEMTEDEQIIAKVCSRVVLHLKKKGLFPITYPIKNGLSDPWAHTFTNERIITKLFGMPAVIVARDEGYHEVDVDVTINPPEKAGRRLARRTNKTDLLWVHIKIKHEDPLGGFWSFVKGSIETRRRILATDQ